MKKHSISLLLGICILTLIGCGAASEVSNETETETQSSDTNVSKPAAKVYDYVHTDDGYFNLLEEYPEITTESQEGGTCWLYSAACNMETAYVIENGTYTDLDPLQMLEFIYINEKDEGFMTDDGIDPMEVGGWQWMVTETLSRGFDNMTLESTNVLDISDRDLIKENLRTRGGVSVGVNDTSYSYKGMFGQYYTMNYTEEVFDHDITIIGYDDHFPKDYFKIPAEEDGAWITYNSLSPSTYFYLSYCAPIEYGLSHQITDKYTKVLSYDAGNEEDNYLNTGESTTTANIFDEPGTLAAIGTYNDFEEQDILIEIYDTEFKKLLYSQEDTLDFRGYHTVELDTPLEVTGCAIAITYSKGAPVEGETIDYGNVDYVTKPQPGVSFIKLDTWKDLTEEGIESELGTDFKPGNCCIKALYL